MNIVQCINAMISPEYCHRQLAEECTELAHAALKMVRVMNHETPKAPEEAMEALIEEMADVLMYYNDVMLCYGITADELRQAYTEKFEKNMKRW